MMKKLFAFLMIVFLLAGCAQGVTLANGNATSTPSSSLAATATPGSPTPVSPTPAPQITPVPVVPSFEHIIVIIFENRDYKEVIGNPKMPFLNQLAKLNVLLTNYYAVTHPSLPNYIALVSGSTQGINSDCTDCFVNAPNLADQIESSGRTWKAYEESMPAPCTVGNSGEYAQKHDPFIYFDSIRLDTARCNSSIVPLTQLTTDLAANQLPNFVLIEPNMCNSGHDCGSDVVDAWLNQTMSQLQSSPALGSNYLIAVTYDEAQGSSVASCCGMGSKAGGQIATILVSPQTRKGIEDGTAYSHYSLLKTIETAWGLGFLGAAQKDATPVITAPWLNQTAALGSIPSSSSNLPASTPVANRQLSFPIRAAFYYPWFPEAWQQSGMNPFTNYLPSLGYYSLDDPKVIQGQIAAMQYAKIQVGISSWWGQGTPTDSRLPSLLKAAENTGFYWTVYYEQEGSRDPSVSELQADLKYIEAEYASSPAYLPIDGRFVVFVYADGNDNCGMVDRWTQANTVNAYLVLKVFPGYRSCISQPDAWHQYAPSKAEKQVGQYSFTISPGFWKAGVSAAALERDLARWNSDIRAMLSADVKFDLITTFNEWGEGTAIESAAQWQSSTGYGLYLDALHNDGITP